ncbi:hypothetical protein QWY87_12955 [Lutimonas halocynthiae]|uniref:hypothetical protein n=1 Tax=Lutimonas halocynthiae TaxID=1446477 RepID=UPI0025B54573|nr:hypothetical protein [Lutimonas halocynthiae]MDN3643619.1 hypothetical protein [Lutimonas halocynthiae]
MDINTEINQVIENFPELNYDRNNNCLWGIIKVSGFDFYQIKIDLKPYPEFFPLVYELDGRIPRRIERHVYSDSGSCCFTTKARSQILLKTKITSIYLFIKNIVIPYFQNNSYYEINMKYKTDEYSHNGEGVIEGYRDILQIHNDLKIAELLFNRYKGGKLKVRDLCYCGSNIKLKKCTNGIHDICYRDFKKIDKNILGTDLINYFYPHLKSLGLVNS